MTRISQPGVSVSIASAITNDENQEQRVLFVGQQNGGTATSGALTSNIQNDNSWDTLYGQDSMLAEMIRNARQLNAVSQFDAIGLDDNGSGVDAEITLTVAGTATETGSLIITVGSLNNHTVAATITDADTATLAGDAVAAAINGDATMPFTAVNVVGVVTLTSVNAGTYGNTFGIEIVGTVAGITTVLASSVTGSVDPILTSVFDVVTDTTRYQTVVWPYADATTALRAFLDPRFNATDIVLDGVGVTAAIGSATTLGATYGALNSQSLVVIGDVAAASVDLAFQVPSIFEIPAAIASRVAAIRSLRLTEGANIASFLSGATGTDAFGGPQLAARPYFNTPDSLLPVPGPGTGFTREEIEDLLDDGVTVMGANLAANLVILGETVTTYKTDGGGNPDLSFKFLNFVDTASNVREYFANNLRSRFAQSRLTGGDLVPGIPGANTQLILATVIEFYQTLSGTGFGLTQAGEIPLNTFKLNTTVTLDLATGTATINMESVPLVTQLRQINAVMTIAFSANG